MREGGHIRRRTRTAAWLCGAALLLTACGQGELETAAEDAALPLGDLGEGQPTGQVGIADFGRLYPPDAGLETDASPGPTVADAGLQADATSDALASDMGVAPVPPTEPDAGAGPPPDCTRLRVGDTGGIGLNVRPGPNTDDPPLENLPEGTVVDVLGVADGEPVNGNTTWYEIRHGDVEGYVSAVWAECIDPNAPPPPPPDPDDFRLPFTCGDTYEITQGNNSAFSHNGRSRYAFDFSMALGTPMRAMKAGRISHLYDRTGPGDACYNGGGRECINAANYVVIAHDDDTQTGYAHLRRVDVALRERVAQGQQIGLSGSTGWSTGPHAHVERSDVCGDSFCQTIGLRFADVPGDGVPGSGDRVTSENGCQ